jgi:excisionase family DNA binding protein
MSDTIPTVPQRTELPALRWWSDKQVARWLNCSWRHVRRMADRGELPRPRRIGRLLRWDSLELEAWATSRKGGAR